MERFFKRLSIILSIIMIMNIIVFSYDVKAKNLIEGPSSGFNWFDWSIEALQEVGLIFNPNILHPTPLEMAQAINNNDSDANVEGTNESINDYINNNTTYDNSNNSKTYNDNSKFILNYLSNYYINDSGMSYTYTQDMQMFASSFASQDVYKAFKSFCEANQDNNYIVTWSGTNCVIVSQNSYSPIITANAVGYKVSTLYSLDSWSNAPNQDDYKKFTYNGTEKAFIADENLYKTALTGIYSKINPEDIIFGGNAKYISYGKTFAIPTFNSVAALQDYSVGQAPYYYNSQVYNNWKNSTGDYTVTTDNSNKVTYGDIITYNNQRYTETGTYPTPTEIEIHIIQENQPTPTPTPNPDNPSGGGSGGQGGSANATGGTATANNEGINITINNNHNLNLGGGSGSLSGNTVSGNGTGSSGGIGGIFDFLSQIGDFLGSLIKNIGNVLADIVTGIGSVVTSLLEVIPTVFNDFLGGVLGWLPPELRALVTLSISAMIIVGLIKLFRG